MRQYIALIHKDADSDFGVSFPDLPGCVTAGAMLDRARDMAEEALAFHIEGLEQDGEALPEPSSLEAVMADPDNRDGVAILVRAPDRPSNPCESTSLCLRMCCEVDRYAEAHGLTRSGFLARAAKREMAG